jgi:hypothetical protein
MRGIRRCRPAADLLPVGRHGAEWNAFVKFERRYDLSLIAGLACFHHGEEGLRQGFGGDVLRLAVGFDQRHEPDVGCRAARGHDDRAAPAAKQMLTATQITATQN